MRGCQAPTVLTGKLLTGCASAPHRQHARLRAANEHLQSSLANIDAHAMAARRQNAALSDVLYQLKPHKVRPCLGRLPPLG